MSGLLTKKRTVAAKIETTPGTPETLAADDGAENFYDPSIEADIAVYALQGQTSISPLGGVSGARSGKATLNTWLYNSGTATPPFWAAVLLAACSTSVDTGVYTPASDSTTTLTIGHYQDGNLYQIAGAQGTFKLTADKVGEPVKMNWEFTGLYVDPSAVAVIAPTFPAKSLIARFLSATITLATNSYVVSKVEFDAGNKVTLREDASNAAGYLGSKVTDRTSKLNITVEVPLVSTHDFFNDLKTNVEAAFSMAIGSGTNKIVTLAIPKAQLMSQPKISDKDGICVYDLEFQCNKDSDAGDDEWTLTLS